MIIAAQVKKKSSSAEVFLVKLQAEEGGESLSDVLYNIRGVIPVMT